MSRRHWNYWLVELLWGQPGRRARRGWRGAHQERRRLSHGIETLEYRVVLSTAPVVTTGQANSISTTAATLTGSVNPEGATSTVLFQYSTNAAFTPTLPTTIAYDFSNPIGVAVDAAGDVFVANTYADTVDEVHSGSIRTIRAGFDDPFGVALDAAGDLFVSNPPNDTVQEILPNGSIKTIGSGFYYPTGVAVNAAGDVFVSDTGHDALKEVLPNGSIETIGSGFYHPGGLALDAAGDVFVSDTLHATVKEVSLNGNIKTIGSGFEEPGGVAVDAAGDVFVADTVRPTVDEVLPDGSVHTLSSAFSAPTGLAVDAAGDLFVVDSNTDQLVELSPATIVASPSSVSGASSTAVSATLTGLVADKSYFFRVVATGAGGAAVGNTDMFTTPNPPVLAIGGPAVTYPLGTAPVAIAPAATLSSGGGAFANASLSVVDASVASYPSDRLSIRSSGGLVVNGVSLAYAGMMIGSFTVGDNGTMSISFNASATQAAVLAVVRNATFTTATPASRSISFQLTDGSGNLGTLVTQTVLSAMFATTLVTGPAKNVSDTGATLTGTANPDGSTATAAFQYSTNSSFAPAVAITVGSGFDDPTGVAVDAAGDVFVANLGNNVVEEILPSGSRKTIGSEFSFAAGVAVNAVGDLFVTETYSSAVEEVLPNGSITAVGAGFIDPHGVAVDAVGDVFVADTNNNAVKEVLPDGSIKTIGCGFSQPQGVAVDAVGDVFVADTGNSAVEEVLPNGDIKTLGSGFSDPSGVAVDAAGDVFVADYGNHAVDEVFPDDHIQTLSSGFVDLAGVASDAVGDVFVVDSENTRAVELSPPTIAATPSPLSGSAATAVSGKLTGLVPGTNYYFRVVASGGGGMVAGQTLEFATPPGPPVLAIGGPAATYSLGGTPIGVAPAATLSSGDGAFAKASLAIVDTTFASNSSDQLSIGSSGGLAVSGASLVFGGATIGSFTGGGNGALSISFNSSATEAAVLAVVHNVTFATATFGNRSIEFQLIDGSGNRGAEVTQTVLSSLPASAVVTRPADNVSDVQATLNGSVNPEGPTTTVAFQSSTDPTFTPSVQTTVIGYAGFNGPSGVAADVAGNLFVADTGNNAVDEILHDGSVKTIGTGFSGPIGVAVDGSGDVFVADTGNNAVKEILPDGSIKTIGPGFDGPHGLAVDAAGDVFVAETGRNAVKEVLANGGIVTVGSGFSEPQGVAVDAAGDVFVADSGHGAVKEVLRNGTLRYVGFAFAVPVAVAVDAKGDVFVADAYKNTVNKVLPNQLVDTIGSGYNSPSGVAVDAAGDVFVADQANNAVKEVSPAGGTKTIGSSFSDPTAVAVDAVGDVFVAEQADNAVTEFLPDGGVKTIGSSLSNLSGLAVDAAGDLYVVESAASDNGIVGVYGAVLEILSDGITRTIASGFNDPSGVAVDAAGDVFLADTGNNAVEEILPDGGIKTIGYGFNRPGGVAVNAAGDVFVADTGDKAVKEILPDGGISSLGYGFGSPTSVAVDAFGDLFVADTAYNAVKEIVPGADGKTSITTIGSVFNDPVSVAVDAMGDVFVLETAVVELAPPTVAATPSPLSGTTVVSISATLTGLSPDTEYYFRLVVSGASGSVVGQPAMEFITPPAVAISGPQASYNIGGVAVALAPTATVVSGDGLFANTSLTIADTNAGTSDQLTIQPSNGLAISTATLGGPKNEAFAAQDEDPTVVGTTLTDNGTVIGTVSGGTGTTPLVITFNNVATQDDVSAVVRSVSFDITSFIPSALNNRQVTLQFANKSGMSTPVTQTIDLSNVEHNPAIFTPTSSATIVGTEVYDNTVTIQNGGSGPVNLSDPTGDLIFVSTVDSPDGSQLIVDAGSVQFYGNVGGAGPLGDLTIETGGQFAVDSDITTTGNIIVTAKPSVPGSPTNLELQPGAALTAAGQVKLLSFNSISIDPGSAINAPSVTIAADFVGTGQFNSSGQAINLGGTITSPIINVQGGESDTLNIENPNGQPGSVEGNTITGYGLSGTLTYAGVQPSVAGTAPVTADTAYVQAVFMDVLGRAVDSGGLQYWTQQLASGMPINNVAQAIAHSAEYFEKFVVEPAFLKLLTRPADSAGLTYWTGQLQNGVTDQQFEAGLVATDEFYNNAGGTDVKWIDAVYELLLDRSADAGGETFWTGELAQGMSRSQVAAGIAGSNENNTQLINADYLHYLGRPADPDGLSYWLARFSSGATNEDVIASFTGSTEYYDKVTGLKSS